MALQKHISIAQNEHIYLSIIIIKIRMKRLHHQKRVKSFYFDTVEIFPFIINIFFVIAWL